MLQYSAINFIIDYGLILNHHNINFLLVMKFAKLDEVKGNSLIKHDHFERLEHAQTDWFALELRTLY